LEGKIWEAQYAQDVNGFTLDGMSDIGFKYVMLAKKN
jgi:hypothetical protein